MLPGSARCGPGASTGTAQIYCTARANPAKQNRNSIIHKRISPVHARTRPIHVARKLTDELGRLGEHEQHPTEHMLRLPAQATTTCSPPSVHASCPPPSPVGPIDRALLQQVLGESRFDIGDLACLQGCKTPNAASG
jgi:hypothetical protein